MATLTVWKFDDPAAADASVNTLESLAKQELVKIHDAATVSWAPDAKKPKTRQLRSLTGAGAMGGMFWGILFGIIFLTPLLGAAIGAATGGAGRQTHRRRHRRRLHQEGQHEVMPGTSALFLMTSDVVPDRVRAAVDELGHRPQLIQSNLTYEQEAELREMLAAN